MPGPTELFLICALIFVLFGAAALPKFAKSLGQTKKAFKEGLEEKEDSK